MASYFELPPQHKAAATSLDAVPADQRRASLLSPAVTQLLDDLGDEKSDSSSEEHSPSDDDNLTGRLTKSDDSKTPKQQQQQQYDKTPAVPSSLSPRRDSTQKKSGHGKHSTGRPGTLGVPKGKHPHMARFHSLRSMLFSANLEDKMQTATHEDCRREEDAANKWKAQHEQRQMHRPKTPEKDGQDKDHLGSRIKTRIRRMTSKDVPTMGQIQEGKVSDFSDQQSTASSDEDDDQDRNRSFRPRDYDEESINHSDVEELVRWVSRQDPPSDGEARKGKMVERIKEDSGHESLGHSDVEDLVRYASNRSVAKTNHHTGYSDASTESDSEPFKQESDENEDDEDLVRWVSHRHGPNVAGPVRRKLDREELDSEVEKQYDSDVPEFGRWVTRHDDTSGESRAASPQASLGVEEEPERGRSRSREQSPNTEAQTHLTPNDVDELVRWVSRKHSTVQDPLVPSDEVAVLRDETELKKESVGMSVDQGSLSHGDILQLVEHVRSRGSNEPEEQQTKPDGPEKGDLRALRSSRGENSLKPTDNTEQKKQQVGMSIDEGSLSHSDVKDIIEHVKSKPSATPDEYREDPSLVKMQTDHLNPMDNVSKGDFGVHEEEHRPSLDHEDVDELVRWVSQRT